MRDPWSGESAYEKRADSESKHIPLDALEIDLADTALAPTESPYRRFAVTTGCTHLLVMGERALSEPMKSFAYLLADFQACMILRNALSGNRNDVKNSRFPNTVSCQEGRTKSERGGGGGK